MTNILIVCFDDMFDYQRMRSVFGVDIQTPNLDAFAAEATDFRFAASIIPVCEASRSALWTGRVPSESASHGIGDPWYTRLPPIDSLHAQLRRAGYWSATTGKIYHGVSQPPEIEKCLFEHPVKKVMGNELKRGKKIKYGGRYGSIGYSEDDTDPITAFKDGLSTNDFLSFLNTYNGDRNWVFSLGYSHPHYNYECPDRFYQMYDQSKITTPAGWDTRPGGGNDFAAQFIINQEASENGMLSPENAFSTWRGTIHGVLASVSHVDFEFGRAMAALAESGHAEDTVVLIVSDHGFQLGDTGTWDKFTLWDESAIAPLMVRVPGGVARKVNTPVTFMDIYPTILDYAGVEMPWRRVGQSLRPLIEGRDDAYQDIGALTLHYGSASWLGQIDGSVYRYTQYIDGSLEFYESRVDFLNNHNLAGREDTRALEEKARRAFLRECARYGITYPDTPAGTSRKEFVARVGSAAQDYASGGAGSQFATYGTTEGLEGGDGIDLLWGVAPEGATIEMPEAFNDFRWGARAYWSPNGDPAVARILGNRISNRIRLGVVRQAEVDGGGGDDYIEGGWNTSNRLFGGTGNDTLIGKNMDDFLVGGTGNDVIVTGAGNNTIHAGPGHDQISTGRGKNLIHTDAGASKVRVRGGENTVHCKTGDEIWLHQGKDTIHLHGSATVNRARAGKKTYVAYPCECMPRIRGFTSADLLDLRNWHGTVVVEQHNKFVLVSAGADAIMLFGTDAKTVEAAISAD